MSDTLTALVEKCAALDSLTARMGMVYQQEMLNSVGEVLSAYRALARTATVVGADDYPWETPLAVQKAVNAYHMHGDAVRLNALDATIRAAITAAEARGVEKAKDAACAEVDEFPMSGEACGELKYRIVNAFDSLTGGPHAE